MISSLILVLLLYILGKLALILVHCDIRESCEFNLCDSWQYGTGAEALWHFS
ncbi:hypothetical protein OROMI_023000 [Orobanche minor]